MLKTPGPRTDGAPRWLMFALAALLAVVAIPVFGSGTAHAQDVVVDFEVDPPISAIAGDTPFFGSLTTFSFDVEVFNDSEDDAEDVVFEFFVPKHTFVTAITFGGDPLNCQAGTPGDSNNPANCRLGTLNEGDDPIIVHIELNVNADTPELTWLDIDVQACYEDDDSDGAPQTSCDGDEFPSDNEAHAFTFVRTAADLNIVKSHTPAGSTLNAGEDIDYVSTVTNSGPSVARGMFFTDTLPPGVIFQGVEVYDQHGSRLPLGGDLNCGFQSTQGPSGTVWCELGDLPPGQPIQAQLRIVISAQIAPSAPAGFICNTSSVRSLQTTNFTADTDFAPFAGDLSNPDCVTLRDRAQVVIRKSSSPLHPVAGETFLWSYEIENLGPTDARDVLFTDTLPQGLAADGSTVYFDYIDDQAHAFCSEVSSSPSVINCRPTGSPFTAPPYVLPAGETVTFSVLVRIPAELVPGTYTNTGSVAIDNSTFTITTFSDDIEVRSVADLKVQKFVSPHNPVRAGEQFTYTILVDNLGPSTAYNIVVTDTLISSGLVRANGCSLAIRTSGGSIDEFSCNFALSTGVFDFATMGANHLNPRSTTDMGRAIITINATADQPIDLTNTVTVRSDSFDPDLANNMAMVAHSVSAVSDIAVTKTAMGEIVDPACGTAWIFDPNDPGVFPAPGFVASPTNVTAGRRISYTLTVTNNGPSHAENVVLSDRLPAGVTVVPGSLVASQGSCQTGTPGDPDDRLTCGIGYLPAGDSATVTFNVVTDNDLAPAMVLENDVFASADQFDDDNANNYAFTQTIVNTWADTEITKISVGDNITGYDATTMRPIHTDVAGQATAGLELRYELTVQNRGPSVVRNAQVLDLLPGQQDTGLDHDPVTFLRADGAYCRPADELQEFGVFGAGGGKFGQVLWCNLGDLAPGERVTFDIYVSVDPSVPDATTLTNGAFVWWGASSPPAQPGGFLGFPFPQIPPFSPITDDPCLDNNYFETDTLINAVADVGGPIPGLGESSVRKMDVPAEDRLDRPFEPDLAIAGDEHRYEITIGNAGPSDAQGLTVIDTLDFKQAGIAGETFLRCEPLDPDDEVTCIPGPGPNQITVQELIVQNEPIITGGVGVLPSMSFFQFYLITEVDSGYVLDADDTGTANGLVAQNQIDATATTTDFNLANNTDREITEIIAEADLRVTLVDDAAGFMACDPVEPGGTIFYEATVYNDGPSDARAVILEIQLPTGGVALDPDQVMVVAGNGAVIEVRDDGRILVAVGNDPNNEGVNELARLNAGNFDTIQIEAMVTADAVCGEDIAATATVRTTRSYFAPLTGASEVPPVVTGAVGRSWFFLDESSLELLYFIDVANIDNIVAAHIHRGMVGMNGPVVFTLYGGAPPPFGPGNPIGGVVQLSAGDVADLDAQRFYVNVHTTDVPSGEIRGQIALDPAAPTPYAPGIGLGPRTPTLDPNPLNNTDAETTTVVCPAIAVRKTVSFDGQCPGVDLSTVVNQTGQAVTYCYEISNTGTTFLDTILLTDTLTTRTTMATVIFTDVITAGPVDPKLPLGPGETVLSQVTVPHVTKECGTATDVVDVTAVAVNSGRTLMPCINGATAQDTALIEIPCDGVGHRLQLPVVGGENCDTWIQVQNVGNRDTKAMLVFWGEPGACPPQAAGPLKVECSGLLAPGTAWSFAANQIPAGANSGMVYTLPTDKVVDYLGQRLSFADLACMRLFDMIVGSHEWWYRFDTAYRAQEKFYGPFGPSGEQLVLDFETYLGEPLAATVNRACPDPTDPNVVVHAAYRGVSADEEGARDPVYSGYTYYAPLVFAGRGELNSTLYIHNSGDECTSLELWFSAQDNCLRSILGDVLSLAPGETVTFDPNTVIGPDWLGSAWIRASQPLGLIVDSMAPNHFTSYAGVPADVYDLGFSLGNQINFAPLIYSEYQGWDSVLQVQNMSGVNAAKVKVYFLDRSGDVITTLVDWVCPRGSQTFVLPVIGALPGNWVGSARAESQEWWTPGQPLVDPPRIQTVVMLEKWADPARTMRREAVAYNAQEECLLYDWQLGSGKGGTSSGSAVFAVPLMAKGNRGITTELGITNLVPKPGFTDFVVYLFDQNGMIDFVCEKLNEKQVEYIDLNSWGAIQPGYLGSAVVSAVFWEHDVFDAQGGFVRNLVGLGGVAVERIGGTLGTEDVPGDESKAFEGFPTFDHFLAPVEPNCPGVSGRLRPGS